MGKRLDDANQLLPNTLQPVSNEKQNINPIGISLKRYSAEASPPELKEKEIKVTRI